MKYPIKRFKSLKLALRDLEQFIRECPAHLQTGKPLEQFGRMLPREVVVNWLLCAAVNFSVGADRLTFCSDPDGGDGVIYDTATGETILTEHTVIPELRGGDAVDIAPLILKAIEQKRDRGEAYAKGKTLVVFQTAKGQSWFPNKVAKQLPDPLYFDAVWVVGLQGVEDGAYVYNVARLDLRRGNAPTWRVRIARDFDGWEVEPIQ